MSETLTFLSRPRTKTISSMNSATGHASLNIIRLDTSETECTEDGLVLMVASGKTLEIDRMQIYGKAIKDSGSHPEALGYYLNDPRPSCARRQPHNQSRHTHNSFPTRLRSDPFLAN